MPAGIFGIKLMFYQKDADVRKVIVVNFDCKESVVNNTPEPAASQQEESKIS